MQPPESDNGYENSLKWNSFYQWPTSTQEVQIYNYEGEKETLISPTLPPEDWSCDSWCKSLCNAPYEH